MENDKDSQLDLFLPTWPEEVRGTPNHVLRSSLFSVTRRGARAYKELETVASMSSFEMKVSGPRLDQADLEVWQQVVHISRQQELGTEILFGTSEFLKSINRSTGNTQYEWLKKSLTRLQSTVLQVTAANGKKAKDEHLYSGNLITSWVKRGNVNAITLDPKVINLFSSDSWTMLERRERQKIAKNNLALWLHGFYSTHAAPYPMNVETIHSLCGSQSKNLRYFKKDLKKALALLKEKFGWLSSIEPSPNGDKLKILRTPSKSQLKHLETKQAVEDLAKK